MSTEQPDAPAAHPTPAADQGLPPEQAQALEDALQRAAAAIDAAPASPVVLLTGASSGIGRAAARDLSQDRLVIAVGRNPERLAEVEAEAGPGGVVPVPFDLDRTEAIEAAFSRLPRVDALVNAAGIAPRTTLEDADSALWRQILETNVIAPAELTRAVLPQLRAAAGPERPATVVFLGSGASRASYAVNVAYAASKHALQAVADGFRKQVEDEGIRVTTIAPGPTDTPMVRWEDAYPRKDPERFIRPETVARSIRHALDAPADTQLTEIWVRPRAEVK